MTRFERKQLRRAISLLAAEDGYHDGMMLLHRLLNPNHKDPLDVLRTVELQDAGRLSTPTGKGDGE